LRVLAQLRAVHGLQQVAPEVQARQFLQVQSFLRHHHLQLAAGADAQLRAGLGADADPVDAGGRLQRAVGFHRDLESLRVQGVDQRRVHLQQGLAAGQHHQRAARNAGRPVSGDGAGQLGRIRELAPAGAVGAHEVGVAEAALRAGAIALAAGPQVAAGEAAEHGGAAGVAAFALQRVEDFLHRIAHAAALPSVQAA
jgi:hypothetical protein